MSAAKQAEHSMLTKNDPAAMSADGFEIGDHGSKNSSMPEFPAALGAQIGTLWGENRILMDGCRYCVGIVNALCNR